MIVSTGLRLLSALCAAPHIAVVISDAVTALVDSSKPASGDAVSPYSLWLQSLCARVQRGPMRLQLAYATAAHTPFALPLLPVQTEHGLRHAVHQLVVVLDPPIVKYDSVTTTSETSVMRAVTAQGTIARVRCAAGDGRLVHLALETIARECLDATPILSIPVDDVPATIRRAAAICARDLSAAASTALQNKACAAHARLSLRRVDWRISVVLGLAARVGVDMPLTAVGKDLLVDHRTILRESIAVDEVPCCLCTTAFMFIYCFIE